MTRRSHLMAATALLLFGCGGLLSACSSTTSLPIIVKFDLHGAKPTPATCVVSGGTTTATGSVAGPGTVNLVLSVQDASGKSVGAKGRASRTVPAGQNWHWTVSADTSGAAPSRCIVSSLGSA